MPISESEQYDLLDQLADEFAARIRRGESPTIKEYSDRYPDLADEIRELFPALVKVERAEGLRQDEEDAHNLSAASPPLSKIGDYRIVREIGRGGMGIVYEAEQISLGRRVALKVLPRRASGDCMVLERFRREARAAARLHHTNIVPVYEVGHDADVRFYAMQFIQGQSLDLVIRELQRLRAGPESKIKAASFGDRTGRRPESFDQGHVDLTFGADVDLSAVVQSILSGGYGAGGGLPLSVQTSQSRSVAVSKGGLAAPVGMALEGSATGSDPALVRTEAESATPGAANRPTPAAQPAPDLSLSADMSSGTTTLPGGTQLTSVDSRRRAFFRSLAQIGRQVAAGLAYAHARGIVHRDIKPSNLLLDTEGVVWITDFGLAKGDDEGLTQSGDILGTIRYMAPERFRGEGDARADIYALGLTLYELLTLSSGFSYADRLSLIERIKTEEPRKPRAVDPRIPRDLETIVLKAIEKDPMARYQSAEAMGDDLGRFLGDEPIRARRTSVLERSARWARHHKGIAVLGALLTAVLIAATTASLFVAGHMAALAEHERNAARAERLALQEANRQASAQSVAREEADQARAAAQSETYRAMLSEVKALRAGHQPGWRDEALADLARLATMPMPGRDVPGLRTEATACLATPDIRLEARIELPTADLRSIAFSPDGETLVTAGHQRGLDFWDVRGQKHVAAAAGLTVTDAGLDQVVYLPQGQGLAVATSDHGVVFTDTRGIRTNRAPITRAPFRPIKLAVSADGGRIAVAWNEGTGITVHNAVTGALLEKFAASPFALSPDGGWLARQERTDAVLHQIGSGQPPVLLGRQDGIHSFDYSADGAMLAAASDEHTTMLWEVAKRKQFGALRGHRERVNDVAFSPDGEWVATVSGDYTTRIWDARMAQVVATLPASAWMQQVEWSPDGEYVAATTDSSQTVLLFRVMGRHRVQQWLTGHQVELCCVAARPGRERFATLGYTELVTWDVSAALPSPRRIGTEPGAGTAVAYSPDGSLLATGSWSGLDDGKILVRDACTGEVRGQLTGLSVPHALVFDATGKRLASGDLVGNLVIWDLATMRQVARFVTGSTAIWAIAFLDNGRRLVTHGSDTAVLYDLESGAVERRLTLEGGVRRFVVDLARNRLVVAFKSGAIGSVSLDDLSPGLRLENAHEGALECIALSPDGRRLATGGADHRVVLRDPLTFAPLFDFPRWTGNLRDMAFDSTSRRLAIVGSDSRVDLWDLVALHDDLGAVGLAWDRSGSAAAPSASPISGRASLTHVVSVIRP
jgi:serine/threonine protein kinase/WD40 repeat protein